ncbi:hypothetical protein CPB84DRAFT_1748943 [Gymnopilus junonius]|uniref:Uncharacterized protein n=1 Tax=Gymnopilus junonius TaxID=109634 RepID=A0A9P5TK49_GYMJU|nr:hypothetical protein CPB84DRAFT_1748943 [Gymnopilus junonius]
MIWTTGRRMEGRSRLGSWISIWRYQQEVVEITAHVHEDGLATGKQVEVVVEIDLKRNAIGMEHKLKMESTSGQYGRWSGRKRTGGPRSCRRWINAKTEGEWNEWEKEYLEERRLKDTVENWQRRVLPPSKGPSLAIDGHPVGSVHVDVGVPVPHEPGTSNQVEQPQAKVTLKASATQIKNQLALLPPSPIL